MKVTTRQLKVKGACPDQVITFRREWPNGVEITPTTLQRAVELQLDLDWFVFNFLPVPAWEAYLKAKAPAREAYLKAVASAREAYEKAMVSALHQIIEEAERMLGASIDVEQPRNIVKRRAFLALPIEQRRKKLAEQAKLLSGYYEKDRR